MKVTVSLLTFALAANAAKDMKEPNNVVSLAAKTYTWESTISSAGNTPTTTQTLSVSADAGATYDFPIGWDEVDDFYLAQSVSVFLGGK